MFDSKRIAALLLRGVVFILMLTMTSVSAALTLDPIAAYPDSPIADWFDASAAEAVGYDGASQRLVITNRETRSVHVVDISNPAAPALINEIDVSPWGKEPTNLDVKNGLAAVTIAADNSTDNGMVLLFSVDSVGVMIPVAIEVGALPDAVKFTPDGSRVVVLNEGEPNKRYTVDPEGSISIVDLHTLRVRTAGFKRYNRFQKYLMRKGIRIFGPNATVAQDLEPENVTISADSRTAWVTLQENNAFAIVDLRRAKVRRLVPLGYKKHSRSNNELDASDKDKEINITNWPVLGMYQPDGIDSYRVGCRTWLVTANEGDARDYTYEEPTGELDEDGEPEMEEVVSFSEEARVDDLALAEEFEEAWPDLQKKTNLGRLKTTTAPPFGKQILENGDEEYGRIYSYGARSFSIWSSGGRLVYDSGSDFERITAEVNPDFFNSNNTENKFDKRSDDKGPEPEGVEIGTIGQRTYAFISLERIGGIMVYDISVPWAPTFVTYENNRFFDGDPEEGEAEDLGPEGMIFIPAQESPSGVPLLVSANEVSGNTTIFQLQE